MKTAAAVLAGFAACTASAQSSLTVFGIADVGITRGTGSIAGRTQVNSGALAGSRLGFRGSEDLGSGLRANFWLEAGLFMDNGAGAATNTNNQASGAPAPQAGAQGLTFNRASWVGLSSTRWGEVRLGRDYTPTFNGHVWYDPTLLTGVGVSQTGVGSLTIFAAPNGARASNSVQYILPNMGGFSGQFMHARGENPSNAGATRDDGNYTGARLFYSADTLSVSVAAASYKMSAVGDLRELVLGATYALGPTKLWGIAIRNETGTSSDMKGAMLGVTHAVGPAVLKASVSRSILKNAAGAAAGTTDKLMLGAVYNLSTRTALYVTGARTRNRDGAAALPQFGIATTAPNQPATGFDLGLRHTF